MISFLMKRLTACWIVFLALIMAVSFSSCESGDGNLIANGSFESLDSEGMPESWYTDAYNAAAGYTLFSTQEDPERGTVAEIRNLGLNDARFAQSVRVEPDTVYCLSGLIRAEGVEEGHGANLSIEDVYAFSEEIFDTDGAWQYIEYYGETGPDQHDLTVFVRLGGYSGESTGRAAFDGISLKKADTIPDDVIADRWYRVNTSAGSDDRDAEEEGDTAGPAWPFLLVTGCIWALAFLLMIRIFRDGERTGDAPVWRRGVPLLPILLFALGLRMLLSYRIEGYQVDVNCFLSWGHTMAQWGPAEFYSKTSFCDYPPLYLYVLGLNSALSSLVGAGEGWTRVIFRLIPSLCDLTAVWMLDRVLRRDGEHKNRLWITAVLAFMALNPAVILNSAAWGQMDSVLCLLLTMVAVCAVEKKWQAAIPIYALSVLIKPQALMLGFLGLGYIILSWIRHPEERKRLLAGLLIGLAALAAGILPFGIRQPFGWLIERYGATLSSYPYATLNTANLYYLAGGNWSGVDTAAHWTVPVLFALLSVAYGTYMLLRRKNLPLFWLEGSLGFGFTAWFIYCAVASCPWAFAGAGAMALSFVVVLSLALRSGEIRFLPYLGALLFVLLYVFGVKMHERYLFPALFLMGAAWAYCRDRRILYLLILFSSTLFINAGIVLDNSIRLGSSMGHLNRDTTALACVLSVMNCLGAAYAVYIGFALCSGGKPAPLGTLPSFLPVRRVERAHSPLDWRPDRSLHWKGKDTLILLAITAAYSFISLSTLGSGKAPQRAWTSSGFDEQVVFDLGKQYDDVQILYFAQVSRNDFSFAQSDDGTFWSEETMAEMDQGQCWKWKYVTQSREGEDGKREYYTGPRYIVSFSGRYIRLTAGQLGLTLNEVLFRDPEGQIIPATIVSRSGETPESELCSDPAMLLDEQDTLEAMPVIFGPPAEKAEPSWWNSSYFDEIYHARTGFEFLRGTTPYETSHPPLGKVLMSVSIALFGMTPFGWRFAGALAGILMLPGMYLIVRQLTKKTWLASVACLLMALDCMHLTQTQIATIDSFPVLFIIYAFFFMLRYMQTDLVRSRMKDILMPLFFSGLFMGLAIASKWIGIYAGMGLAVLFVFHGIRHLRLNAMAVRLMHSDDLSEEEKGRLMPYVRDPKGNDHPELRRLMTVCLWCLLFFIAVPLAIYLLSYIPYMAYNHRIRSLWDFLAEVWKSQTGMLNYHSTPGLGMDHPFYSPWYEWPVIGKPMYYASDQYPLSGTGLHHSIFSFGNPVVWWGGLGAMLLCVLRWLMTRRYLTGDSPDRWHLNADGFQVRYVFLFIGFLAQYLPWVLVPRGTYIYHYFASIPFLIVAVCLCLDGWGGRGRKTAQIIGWITVALALAMLIILFPYASGMPASAAWMDLGRQILRIWY